MKSSIDEKLSADERVIWEVYTKPSNSDLRRQTRLSIQYAIGAGFFLWLALSTNDSRYAIAIYVTLVALMYLRIRGARAISGMMPRIIEKYEDEINALRSELEASRKGPSNPDHDERK